MKSTAAFLIGLMTLTPAFAAENHHAHHAMPAAPSAEARIAASAPLKAGEPFSFTLSLAANGAPLGEEVLKEVHTRKVHLLVVDETLADYHHLHPAPAQDPGSYAASFTPAKTGNYKIWADVTPLDGKQQFIVASLPGEAPCAAACVDTSSALSGTADGMKADISFEAPLKAGAPAMGTVRVSDGNGTPATDLEPVMGAFAHIVGFYDDFSTVAHIHPMGREPSAESERGGPDLSFHLSPEKPGFLKLFVQIRKAGKDIFIPLGVNVAP